MALAVTGISFPAFALGMLLMQIFSVELGWLPTVGADTWKHYILPSDSGRCRCGGNGALYPRFVR
jgi:glutathione transport system permease protein